MSTPPAEAAENPVPGGHAANSTGVAQDLRAEWLRLTERLSPVIGARGMAALYERALHLAGAQFPRLRALPPGAVAMMDLDQLVAVVEALDTEEATTISNALLARFRELLASLVGAALTDQLIGPAQEF